MDKKFYRLLDANFNRAKEGLRVCEDICRFVLDDKTGTKKLKTIRHELTDILASLNYFDVLSSRNVGTDLGRKDEFVNSARRNLKDVYLANSQRVKESIRVLEEFMKLMKRSCAKDFKKMRYAIYDIEKKIASKL